MSAWQYNSIFHMVITYHTFLPIKSNKLTNPIALLIILFRIWVRVNPIHLIQVKDVILINQLLLMKLHFILLAINLSLLGNLWLKICISDLHVLSRSLL